MKGTFPFIFDKEHCQSYMVLYEDGSSIDVPKAYLTVSEIKELTKAELESRLNYGRAIQKWAMNNNMDELEMFNLTFDFKSLSIKDQYGNSVSVKSMLGLIKRSSDLAYQDANVSRFVKGFLFEISRGLSNTSYRHVLNLLKVDSLLATIDGRLCIAAHKKYTMNEKGVPCSNYCPNVDMYSASEDSFNIDPFFVDEVHDCTMGLHSSTCSSVEKANVFIPLASIRAVMGSTIKSDQIIFAKQQQSICFY